MLASMLLNQKDAMKGLRGSFSSMFSPSKQGKNLRLVLSLLVFAIASPFASQAQTLTVTSMPEVVCEGNNFIVHVEAFGFPASPNPTAIKKYLFYDGNGGMDTGDVNRKDAAILNPPGIYFPYVVALLENGDSVVSAKIKVTVWNKPISALTSLTQGVQCLLTNNVCFGNASQRATTPSTPLTKFIWTYGDAFYDSVYTTTDVCHHYENSDSFNVGLRTIDSLGCYTDAFLSPNSPQVFIKPKITPKFSWTALSGPCFVSQYLFTNSTPISPAGLLSYCWSFGDDSTYCQNTTLGVPFTQAQIDSFVTKTHKYTINGKFNVSLTLTDTTGCTDSIRYTEGVPQNIVFDFDIVTTGPGDSTCKGKPGEASICFQQTPNDFAGPDDIEWNFGDPDSGPRNSDKTTWSPCHTFVGPPPISGLQTYYVTFTISNVCPGNPITHTYYSAKTLSDNQAIDKFIYADNDQWDPRSQPVRILPDTMLSGHNKELKLVWMGGVPSMAQPLFAYKPIGKERPIYYLDSSRAFIGGVILDTVVAQVNIGGENYAGFDTAYGYGVRVIGPFARIPNPPAAIVKPFHINQCGPTDTVDFVNTSLYYKSRKVFRLWDFDDRFAPQCTSFSIPKAGFPPIVGTIPGGSVSYDNGRTITTYPAQTVRMWTDAQEQYDNSDYYFIKDGNTYGGKMNCKFSMDTLPKHIYPNWDTVYKWHLNGNDFFDIIGGAGPPVYLNPVTGEYSPTQGTGPAPYGNWVRIDTMKFGIQDLLPGAPIQVRDLPDPFRMGLVGPKGRYNMIPSASVEPNNTIAYYDAPRDSTYFINGSDILPNSNMTFYQYAFNRTVTRCINVRLTLKDSLNNTSNQGITLDENELDAADCNMEAILQLSFSKADGYGLGKGSTLKECPGASPNGVSFELAAVSGFPGTKPECGQTFLLFNFDSLADRKDATPCALDGFVNFTGTGITTTPGGLSIPPFFATTNYTPIPWTSSSGTRIIAHYGPNAPANRPQAADTVQGYITVGIIIGSGCKEHIVPNINLNTYKGNIAVYGDENTVGSIIPTINTLVPYPPSSSQIINANPNYDYEFNTLRNYRLLNGGNVLVDIVYSDCNWPMCLADTVWYHRFLQIKELNEGFDLLPQNVRLRHVGDEVQVHYWDTIQENLTYTSWSWGDQTVTVDSFEYDTTGKKITNGYFINGVRRVRYNFDMISGNPVLLNSTVWPIRSAGPGIEGLKPGILVKNIMDSTLYQIYDNINRTAVTDSIRVRNICTGVISNIANVDTMKYFPVVQVIDTALALLPVKHTFIRTSWEAREKSKDATILPVIHIMRNENNCDKIAGEYVTIGIIDTLSILNMDGKPDTLFCKNEPVYFIDSLRYWRNDNQLTDAPNGIPAISRSPAYSGDLAPPYERLQIDSADFWRQDEGDPNPIQQIFVPIPKPYAIKFNTVANKWDTIITIDTVVPERIYWDFGDGSPIDSSVRPVHRYQTNGAFKIMMVSKDSLSGFDTCYARVIISEPAAKIGFVTGLDGLPKDIFNCGDFADMIDSSYMKGLTQTQGIDSVKTNYWWFGDRSDTTKAQANNNFFPKWGYLNNGSFQIKLVTETYLGCKDTTYDTVFVRGPRPEFTLVNAADTIGCAPFTVKMLNLADSNGKYVDPNGNTFASDTPTLTTYFDMGDGSVKYPVFGRRDTVLYTYDNPGVYEIYAYGSDGAFGAQNKCDLAIYPDTNRVRKIRITVLDLKRNITLDKDIVCKLEQLNESSPVTISNASDPMYIDYSYVVQRKSDSAIMSTQNQGGGMPQSVTQTFPDTGNYRIIATPIALDPIIPLHIQNNCKISDTLDVRVVSPAPAFTIDTIDIPKVKFNNTSDTVRNVAYSWLLYKLSSKAVLAEYQGTNKNPDFAYDFEEDTGMFVMCLTSTAKGISISEACADSVCQYVKNSYTTNVEVPNVFSPNADGSNDMFKIRIEGQQKYKLTIYNRWGAKVFESGDAAHMWNGKVDNDGAECPAGVYYYIFDYKLRGGEDKTRTGTITMIR
jgi:gliding motility-associated-like protein